MATPRNMALSPNPMVDQAILLVLMLWGDEVKEAQDWFVNRRLGVRFLSPAPQIRPTCQHVAARELTPRITRFFNFTHCSSN